IPAARSPRRTSAGRRISRSGPARAAAAPSYRVAREPCQSVRRPCRGRRRWARGISCAATTFRAPPAAERRYHRQRRPAARGGRQAVRRIVHCITSGAAGCTGCRLARRLLADGPAVTGYDGVTDYYDPALKRARLAELAAFGGFRQVEGLL